MKMKELTYRGSYNVHLLLHLLNELGIRDNMRGLPSILSLFNKELNKLKNTGTQILISIDHMILKVHILAYKAQDFAILLSCDINYYDCHYMGAQW